MKKGIKIILAGAICFCMLLGANAYASEKDQRKNVETISCSYIPLAAPSDTEMLDASILLEVEGAMGEDAKMIVADGYEEDGRDNKNDDDTADGAQKNAGEKQNDEGATNDAQENGFEEIYNLALDHISEILSLAAFIGSIICAIIYKSGLMPLMENGLTSLKNAMVKIKEATNKAESESKECTSVMTRRIEALENSVTDMCQSFLSLSDALNGYKNQISYQKRMDTILEGELDMLYDIFMTSALPEYEKARVGERMSKLKEVLKSGEGEK